MHEFIVSLELRNFDTRKYQKENIVQLAVVIITKLIHFMQ